MDRVKDLIRFLQALIPLAGGARIVYCYCAQAADQDEAQTFSIRRRNVLIFIVVAEIAGEVLQIVFKYLT